MSNYLKQSPSFIRAATSGILLFALSFCTLPLNLAAQASRQLTREENTRRSDTRIALVIGNGDYAHTTKLDNPVNDATDMAQALKELGFEVITGTNQNRLQMRNLIRDFGSRLTDTKGVGLFFYAGHGLAVNGDNYLVPVDADIKAEDEIADLAVSMNFLLGKMAAAQNGFNMVILDACRNNPFARSWRNYRDIGDKGGLARVNAPTGTLIAYATKPGEVASDGRGRNGLYTEALLKQMRVKDVDVTKMLQNVRAEVLKNSDNKQVPFDESSLVGDFYFAGKGGDAVTNTNPDPTPAKTDRIEGERAFWKSIENSTDPEDFEFYLKKYPEGEFAPVAENSLRRLRKTQTPSSPTNVPTTTGAVTPGTVRKSPAGIELVYIPPGEFMMGSENGNDDEKPIRRVTIRDGFWMGRYEVTQGQWRSVMGVNPSYFKDCGDNCPVEQVSWNDALDFIEKLNAKNDGFIYSLPSEAQWEYAARAGTTGDYYGAIDDIAWYGNNSGRSYLDAASIWKTDEANYPKRMTDNGNKTHPVGQKKPNAFGLYDMSGNVWEWVEDIYNEKGYTGLPTDGSANESVGDTNTCVLRGGSWFDLADDTRSAVRGWGDPSTRANSDGFRVLARPTSAKMDGASVTPTPEVNLALGKLAAQSSNIGPPYDASEGLASLAVDGNTNGDWFGRSVTHTNDERSENPWWRVDLGAEYNVNKVQIWNRTDCCSEALTNYRIVTSASAEGGWEEFSPGMKTFDPAQTYPLTFTGNKRARYVMVQIIGPSAVLMLAEVKVFGTPVGPVATQTTTSTPSEALSIGDSSFRILRGGSFFFGSYQSRSAARDRESPGVMIETLLIPRGEPDFQFVEHSS